MSFFNLQPQSIHRLSLLLLGVALSAASLTAQDSKQKQKPDRNEERLRRYLQQNPKSDLNGDGKLTLDERRKFLQSQNRAKSQSRNQNATGTQNANRRRPKPTHADVRYGDHERHVFDLYLAKSEKPTPLVIYIHGGGFRGGSKNGVSAGLIERCHKAGFSVASLNYRLTDSAPFPAPMHDCARAVQTLRHNATKWNLDPTRFGATGGSAGAGISLWLAFHEDLANLESSDPIAGQSTRLSATAVSGAQIAYDPRWIKKHIGGRAGEHTALIPFFAIKPGEENSPRTDALYKESSPINFLTKDDPPVWMIYREAKEDLPANARPGQGIHHPKFGLFLKKEMSKLGLECTVKHVTDLSESKVNVWPREIMDEEIAKFFVKHLKE